VTVDVAHSADERAWLADVLTRQIKLGGAMELEIARLDQHGIELQAPLAPNVNDKGTAFGGALVSLMILAGWSLPRLLLRRAGLDAELVIGRCEVRFLEPVRTGFAVGCDWPDAEAVEHFFDRFRARGRAKLDLTPSAVVAGEVAATLSARYAALRKPDGSGTTGAGT